MPRYDDTLTIREARARYFADHYLSEAGYESRWVRLQAGPIPLYFPNTAARVRSVRLHDIHHTVTDYDTTWTGEGEIGAWEIASGCGRHYPAWWLNLSAFAIGLMLDPGAIFRAFVRGRRSANLYRAQYSDALLAQSVGALRRQLRLDRPADSPTWRDRGAFAIWVLLAMLNLLAPGLIALAVVVRLVTR